jgi:nickel-dependent lactate racemase
VDDVKSHLPASYAHDVHVQCHDSHDRGQLAYLATTQKGTPIYINRFICDADLVIPVGCIRADGALGPVGTLNGVYPSFADAATRRRFQAPDALRSAKGLARLTRELDEATWLLGARFTVQTIPGGGDGLLDVIAGDRDAVQEAGRKRSHAAWSFSVPQRARLVIASLEGGPAQQTWDGFARALLAALRVAEDDGTVAVCTDLARRPGPALSLLIGDLDLDKIEAKIGRKQRADALAATQLIDALRRVRVYLLSQLDREVVEDLGLGHIERPQEVANLCRRHASCILLANSQHAWPSVAADSMVSP